MKRIVFATVLVTLLILLRGPKERVASETTSPPLTLKRSPRSEGDAGSLQALQLDRPAIRGLRLDREAISEWKLTEPQITRIESAISRSLRILKVYEKENAHIVSETDGSTFYQIIPNDDEVLSLISSFEKRLFTFIDQRMARTLSEQLEQHVYFRTHQHPKEISFSEQGGQVTFIEISTDKDGIATTKEELLTPSQARLLGLRWDHLFDTRAWADYVEASVSEK